MELLFRDILRMIYDLNEAASIFTKISGQQNISTWALLF